MLSMLGLLGTWKHLSWTRAPARSPASKPPAFSGRAAVSYAAQWAQLDADGVEHATVTEEGLEAARKAFKRKTQVYLQQLLVVVFDDLPTKSAARTAIRQGRIRVNGSVVAASDAPAPEPGDSVTLHQGNSRPRIADDLEKRLNNWNDLRSAREEAQIRLLYSDPLRGLAVVNKPAGLDSVPWVESHRKKRFTFQDYLPMVVPPPSQGTPCRGPRVCHRLDFRVAGPLLVATSLEAMRRVKRGFAKQDVRKEYRAIVCGPVKEEGASFSIKEPLDDKPSETDVEVLKVVRCPHYGFLSMLALWPKTGRYRQLRRHLAEVLGRPIVNEDEGLFRAAAERWEDDAPPLHLVERGRGNLFLQAVEVSLPPVDRSDPGVTVRVAVSDRFEELLAKSQDAWARGWRADGEGSTRLEGWPAAG